MVRRGERNAHPPAVRSARQRIVAGARRHFFAHGFRGVTVDELAAELGMSKKTLYAYFRSKPEIVEAAILDKFHDLESELDEITAACSEDFVEALRRLLACLHRHTEEIQPPFLRDIRRDSPDLFKLVETRRSAIIQRYFGRLLAAGQRSQMVRKDIPAVLLVEGLLAAIQGVMTPQRMATLGVTPKTCLTSILTVFLEGVLTSAGRTKR